MRSIVLPLALLALAGCPMPQSPAAKMQDAATQFNTDIRFGRLSLAVERVAPKERDAFLSRRKALGDHIKLADYELVSEKMVKDVEAEVVVQYDWYDVATGDLQVTKIRQTWESHSGTWLLGGETRESGAEGLFGEQVAQPEARPRGNVQFPTVRLGD